MFSQPKEQTFTHIIYSYCADSGLITGVRRTVRGVLVPSLSQLVLRTGRGRAKFQTLGTRTGRGRVVLEFLGTMTGRGRFILGRPTEAWLIMRKIRRTGNQFQWLRSIFPHEFNLRGTNVIKTSSKWRPISVNFCLSLSQLAYVNPTRRKIFIMSPTINNVLNVRR